MTISYERSLSVVEDARELERQNQRRSGLLDYLPSIYSGDDFLNRFLCIFEDTLLPLQQMADTLHYYFHPLTCPTELVEWLSNWLYLVLDENWSLKQRRRLIHSACELYSWRGTRRGLAEYLRLYTGVEPDISEYSDGMTLGADTKLGVNTTIAGRGRFSFTVTMRLNGLTESEISFKETTIRRIIEAEKPAHTTYRLRLIIDGKGYGESAKQFMGNLDTVMFALPKNGASQDKARNGTSQDKTKSGTSQDKV